ncbi:hypothetical protein [Leptospira langatensis]|nr:hypothetical protein [Leptospira langatensis]
MSFRKKTYWSIPESAFDFRSEILRSDDRLKETGYSLFQAKPEANCFG